VKKIFKILDGELSSCAIPWKNCLSFAADNASVMMGKTKAVASLLSKKAPNVYILGCACHLIHMAAGKAASALSTKVDKLLIDVLSYYTIILRRVATDCRNCRSFRNCTV